MISLSAKAWKGKYFEKNVRFPEKVILEEKVEMVARLVPIKQQLAWQQLVSVYSREIYLGEGRYDKHDFVAGRYWPGTAGGVVYRGRIGEWYLAGVGKRGYDRL